ncbi:PREDICTED: B- and T-lymphocyte attenuator [Condylura cristata]|uniref:B- and T-lymphocyte attenuator n=1 Tax=Condylura cristata TaxID=143302 RepID=UPI00064339FB|nr:PREDICTED: B- and T-lymphocyte attenuator [Condylura cristata]
MLGIGKLFWVLFLDRYLGVWSTHGEESCIELNMNSNQYNISAGEPFDLECPVKYCANRPNVTWCKFNGTCLSIGNGFQRQMRWKNKKNDSVFVLHFNQVHASDNGSYCCSVHLTSGVMESRSIILYVTEKTQSYSESTPPTAHTSATSASGLPSNKKLMDSSWILYSLIPLGVLPLLTIGVYLFCCLRRHKGEQKKSTDTAGREINLVDVPQSFNCAQTEVGTRQNSQALPSEIVIYDNEPWSRIQDVSGVYSNIGMEENRQGIVYASLNYSVIRMNSKQARQVNDTPTEYAAICVRR